MQYIKQIMLLVILTISWKCQAEEVKEIWLDELGESSYYRIGDSPESTKQSL